MIFPCQFNSRSLSVTSALIGCTCWSCRSKSTCRTVRLCLSSVTKGALRIHGHCCRSMVGTAGTSMMKLMVPGSFFIAVYALAFSTGRMFFSRVRVGACPGYFIPVFLQFNQHNADPNFGITRPPSCVQAVSLQVLLGFQQHSLQLSVVL